MKKLINLFQKYHFIFIFVFLAIIIIKPFREGGFFLLDSGYPIPKKEWSGNWSSGIGWFFLNTIIPSVVTTPIAQKLVFLSTISFLGIGGFKIGRKWGYIPAYFAGLLAIFNPFVYSRILEGQINLVISFTLFLWAIFFLIQYYQLFSIKPLILASILFGFGINFLPHAIFIVFIILATLFIFHFQENTKKLKYILHGLLILGIILLMNINWIIAYVPEGKNIIKNTINSNHFIAFSSDAGDSNIYFNTLFLHGYWGEGEDRFLPSNYLLENEKIIFIIIFCFIIIGIIYGLRKKEEKINAISFLIIAIIAYILSMGIASPHLGFITKWMYENIPFYKTLRESQKWSGALLIIYLYFSAIGVSRFLEWRFIRQSRKIWAIIILTLPIFFTSSILFGFMGQLRTAKYPQDWYQVRETFFTKSQESEIECEKKQKNVIRKCYNVLALPWHQYIGFKFAGRIIANPIESFFYDINILQGDNVEIGNIYSYSNRYESKLIEKYIGPKRDWEQIEENFFLEDLKDLGINYILIAKEADWKNYNAYLKKNPSLKEMWDSDSLLIYRINL